MKRLDLTGQKFGQWAVLSLSPNKSKAGKSLWLCECTCGNICSVGVSNLRSGNSTKCIDCRESGKVKHGQLMGEEKSNTYKAWVKLLDSVIYKPKKIYTENNIKMCERWRDFNNFLADMGETPKDSYITRLNTEKDYCKANCKWTTVAEEIGDLN